MQKKLTGVAGFGRRILRRVMYMLRSVWSEIRLPTFPKVEHDMKTDVLIVGGGMAGLLTAHLLRQAGVDCVLVEAERICRGVTQNTTAKVTVQHGLCNHKLCRRFGDETAHLYHRANEMALERFRQEAEGIDCDWETQDHLVYSCSAPETLEQELTALQRIGIEADFAEQLPLPFPTAGAVRFKNQAQFHPLKFAAAIVDGLRIFERSPVRAFEGSTAVTEAGRIRAEKVVIATHFPILNKHGAYFLKLYQSRAHVLAVEGRLPAQGMYLGADRDGLSFRSHKGLLLIGDSGHRTGKTEHGWEQLEAFVRDAFPASPVRYRWAAQDCMTLDGMPYVGQYGKNTPDLYVAAGFNKWGMTGSMTAAMLLQDLLCDKENHYTEIFSPRRSMLRPQLLVNGVESMVNLATPTLPRCPHMGCALKWNRQERSWDCPCHGSRFSEHGELLDGPSTGDLKHIPKR